MSHIWKSSIEQHRSGEIATAGLIDLLIDADNLPSDAFELVEYLLSVEDLSQLQRFILLCLKADYFLDVGSYEKSIEVLEQAIPLSRDKESLSACYGNMGLAHLYNADDEKAMDCFFEAFNLDRQNGEPIRLLGELLVERDMPREGLYFLFRAVRTGHRSQRAHAALADTLELLNKPLFARWVRQRAEHLGLSLENIGNDAKPGQWKLGHPDTR